MKNGQQASLFDLLEEEPSQPTAHIPGFETMAPETQQALGQMVIAVWDAASSGKLPHQVKKAEAPNTPPTEETAVTGDSARIQEGDTAPRPAPPEGGWAAELARRNEADLANALAFIAVARTAGVEHPALEPIGVDKAGARQFDLRAVKRLANKYRRGVESDRPEFKTAEDWGEAIFAVRIDSRVKKLDAQVREGVMPSR